MKNKIYFHQSVFLLLLHNYIEIHAMLIHFQCKSSRTLIIRISSLTLLLIECLRGTYGINCSHLCGHCSDIYHCSIADGTCQTGCKAGYKGPQCQEGILISLYLNIYIKHSNAPLSTTSNCYIIEYWILDLD